MLSDWRFSPAQCLRLALLGAACLFVAGGAAFLGARVGALAGLASQEVWRWLFPGAASLLIERGRDGMFLALSAGTGATGGVLLLSRLWYARVKSANGRQDALLLYLDSLQL